MQFFPLTSRDQSLESATHTHHDVYIFGLFSFNVYFFSHLIMFF